jgi:DNA polymerase-3 subunit epsilon
MGKQSITAHPTADRLLKSGGMRQHVRDMVKRFDLDHAHDWRGVHARETAWAERRVQLRDFNVLDTETTGVNRIAEMVELAIIGPMGDVVYDGLIRPKHPIIKKASDTHGITNEHVKNAPTLAEEWDAIQAALMSQPWLIIYNKTFDVRILKQSAFVNKLKPFTVPRIDDLMLRFARWSGAWNPQRNGYRWAMLDSGHKAAGDCRACVGLIEKMARHPVTVKW